MQLEINYERSDVEEALIPETYVSNLKKYRRRWIKPALIWLFVAAMIWFVLWIYSLSRPEPTDPAARPAQELLIDLLPVWFFAMAVWSVYVRTIFRTWRGSRRTPGAQESTSRPAAWTRLIVPVAFFFGGYEVIGHNFFTIWHPTRFQRFAVQSGPWVVTLALMIILADVRRRSALKTAWNRRRSWKLSHEISLDESSVRISCAVYRQQLEWTYFVRARETPNLIILIGQDGDSRLLPKRAFRDENQLQECRALLQNSIEKTQFMVKPSGFAVLPTAALPLPEFSAEIGKSSVSLGERETIAMQPSQREIVK